MNILLVETTLSKHSWIGDHLLGLGFNVTTCTELEPAFRAFQERVYPLTLLVVGSLDLEISLLCRHIKSFPKNSQQMIFAVIESTCSSSEILQSLLNAGVDDYICQPFSREEFTARLTTIERQFYRLSQLHTTIQHITTTEQRRKRTEEALRESMEGALKKNWEFFENLNNSFADAIITVKLPEHVIEYANRAVEEIFGYLDAEYLGKTFRMFFPDRDGYREFTETLREATRQEHTILRAEHRLQRKNGECFTAEITTTFLRENLDYIRAISIIRDITERKQMESALERERASLARKVDERTAELQRANTELARASRHKDTFLAHMSHELRTPLNAILGYAKILKKSVNLTPLQREGLETIHSSGEHLLQLINDILDISKIEAGQLELNVEACHLPKCLEHVANMMKVRAERKAIAFRYIYDPNLPVGIYTDEKRLREVLINLLENAIKFTDHGSVTLRVSRKPSTGSRQQRSESRTLPTADDRPSIADSPLPTVGLSFEVEDTGIGIAEAELQNIFLPFQQVKEPQFSQEGTGLGLTISQQFVHMMGGELTVKSVLEQGSVFGFTIEVPEMPNSSSPAIVKHPEVVGYEGPQRTVLVVDDAHENRAILKTILLPLGFEVLEASNGQECLDMLLVHQPDVVLLDLLMPVMDGVETVRHIRADCTNDSTKIVAISASVFDEKKRKILDSGCDYFLKKPLGEDTLLNCLQDALKLEWVHRYDCERKVSVDIPPPSVLMPDVVYPQQEIDDLYSFAVCGNITKIFRRLDHIEQNDVRYRPFVSELRALAKGFQVKKIIACLKALQQKE
ncbi:hypothetical protein CSA56_16565 [candidate division KSB3 bacterium]|uniref:histidine kinase n=1 Tax=candidate division KSB3 bacterium TaxID=2044937 RepID=A0A2G6K8S2_9BACT|nr:MAG: hypothetical protein CSA56_16565 [candidate division KSB3 bacterium]